jgi:hypothetical protein
MAAIAGKGGKVLQGANTLAFVESWELGISDEALESTGLGATARTYIGRGLPVNTGSITWRALDNSGTGEAALRAAALANGTSVALKLYESATKYWDCATCIVTGFSQSVNVDGLVTGSLQFTVSGAPAYT